MTQGFVMTAGLRGREAWCCIVYFSNHIAVSIPTGNAWGNYYAMKLRAKVVPSIAKHLPIFFIVGSLKDNGTNLDSGKLPIGIGNSLFQLAFPQATNPIYAPNLLLDHTGIPFGMQQDDGSARLMEIEPFAAHHRLCDQNFRVAMPAVESQLQEAPRFGFRVAVH